MNDFFPIDLHMHSSVSDGTESPEQLLASVRQAGLRVFSLTDHDALKGCMAVLALRQPGDPLFLTGVEFSCKDELGKYHVLGYGYDPEAASIRAVIKLGHSYRMRKLRSRLEMLRREFGFVFPDDKLAALYREDNPGKPHIANLMVRMGFVGTKEEAFARYLNLKQQRSDDYVRPEEAISGILGAGGIPVLAHPCYGDGDQLILGPELEQRVERLTGFGLQGLEAFYSGFTDKLRAQVLELADAAGLYVTAGSDYHGKNKLVHLGDTGLTAGEDAPEALLRFLREAKIR